MSVEKHTSWAKISRQLIQWTAAFIIAFAVFNGLMFLVYHPVNEMARSGGSSPGLKVSPDYGLYGFEGYAPRRIDSRGYVDPDLPVAKKPYLVVGASHAEGFHTANGRRYSDILNARCGYTDSLKFYNISHSEYFFPAIVRRLTAMREEFPDIAGVIIDIDSTAADSSQLAEAMNQLHYYEAEDSYEALYTSLSQKERLKYRAMSLLPVLRGLSLQYETFRKSRTGADLNVLREESDEEEDPEDKARRLEEYEESMDETLSFISEFPFDIVIVMHPGAVISPEGDLQTASEDTDEIFAALCERYDIPFIDMTDRFEKAYKEEHIVPFGFMNTSMGSGHMNDKAHEMIADAVYEVLDERGGLR